MKQIDSEEYIGLVKWFNDEKGFGFLCNPVEGDYFLHKNNFITKPQRVPDGTAIIFKKGFDQKRNKNIAESCRFIGEPEDWQIIIKCIGKPDIVQIKTEVILKAGTKWSSPYIGNVDYPYSLIDESVKQFFKGKTEKEISTILKDYLVNGLIKKDLNLYCQFLETHIPQVIERGKAAILLEDIYSYFGKDVDDETLFYIWKHKNFRYIAINVVDDMEIAKSILSTHIDEIEIPELKRISGFSFGPEFCDDLIVLKFEKIQDFNTDKILSLFPFLDFLDIQKKDKYISLLNKALIEKNTTEIIELANNLSTIQNNFDFNNYDRLRLKISNKLSQEARLNIGKKIDSIIVEKCAEKFMPELWIKGIVDEVPFQFLINTFLNSLEGPFYFGNDNDNEKRVIILSKLQPDQQFLLLKAHSNKKKWLKTFNVLEDFIKHENILEDGFKFSNHLFDAEYWEHKKNCSVVITFIKDFITSSTDEEKYELFLEGIIQDVPQNFIKQNYHLLGHDECEKIFASQVENKKFIFEILSLKISKDYISSLNWMYDLVNKYLEPHFVKEFDLIVIKTINSSEYFNLWRNGKAKIFPGVASIEEFLNVYFESYNEIGEWVKNKVISQDEIATIFLESLKEQIPVTDRNIFFRQYNHIKYLLNIDKLYFEKLKQINNGFYNILLWFLDYEVTFNFEFLKGKFIYFLPEEQVRIVRKLFWLKAKNEFDLTVDKLDELSRADLDLLRNSLNFHPSIQIDISTDVIIKVLTSYSRTKKFLTESELLTVVLENLKNDKTKRLKLATYFETCKGRKVVSFDRKTNGDIEKNVYGDKFYFAISFPISGTDFRQLRERVKQLPKCKWNPELNHWGVPSTYEKDVVTFAKINRFSFKYDGSEYENNPHLLSYKRSEIPTGISYCDGRLSNEPHRTFKNVFWWCAGRVCFEKCESIHSIDDWENYTLLDFCEILKLSTDSTNRTKDLIANGFYYQFIGLINRFNNLLDKLYCNDCNEILYPVENSHFAAYSVVRFHCVNSKCSNNTEIYLNHCLNGQCNSIIDSRISKRCSNGLYICDHCGSCCSHEMLERRLKNLKATGGFIHPNLKMCVEEKLGHLERAEYFCYKCEKKMVETEHDIFHCNNCDVIYDTSIYNFKRPQKLDKTQNIEL